MTEALTGGYNNCIMKMSQAVAVAVIAVAVIAVAAVAVPFFCHHLH